MDEKPRFVPLTPRTGRSTVPHMKRDLASIEEQAARLPHRERARLALRLIESLEPGQDEDVDALWLDEAERRLRDYERGRTNAREADEAVAEIERQLE